MTSQRITRRHVDGVLRIIRHLWQHPREDTPLAVLADMAHFSPYHFHRIYVGIMKESVNATRQRMRLQQAAVSLTRQAQADMAQLARRSGYRSAAAFCRAFSRAYGLPPGRYRQACLSRSLSLTRMENAMYVPEFRTVSQPLPLAARPHRGDYMQIGQAFDELALRANAWLTADSRWYGIYLDDPRVVAPTDLRAAACVSHPPDRALPEGLEAREIDAGRYVVIVHRGPYSELEQAYGWLYGVWLPASGEALADRPCVEAYLNLPHNTAPKDLLTEIWAPLA